MLEKALEHAKAGGSHSMALVMLQGDEVMNSWHNGTDINRMLGAFELLKFDYLNALINKSILIGE